MTDSTLISGPFGSERVPVPGLPDPKLVTQGSQQPDGPRVPLTEATVAGDRGFAEAGAMRQARADQPEATVLESIGAAVYNWDTSRLIRRIGRPNFENDTPINAFEYLQQVPTVLTDDEREYFMDTAKGDKSAAYALEQIQGRRTAQQAIGDHPVASFVTAFADPLWLAVPPALRLGKTAPVAGRALSGAFASGTAGAVTAGGEGPVSTEEIVLSMALNGAAGAALYRPGRGVQPADADFPQTALASAADAAVQKKPHYKLVDGKPVEVPRTLAETPQEAAVVAEAAIAQNARERGVGQSIMWNMHKTMSGFGPVGKKVADLLYDNNSDLSKTSLESHRVAILDELRTGQFEYEQILRDSMTAQGYGTLSLANPFTSRKAYAAQREIEKAVQRELFRREQLSRQGLPTDSASVPKNIAAMADALDRMHQRALRELKAAGVEGAEGIIERPGYLNRRWSSERIDALIQRLEARGMTREVAKARVDDLVALSLRQANSQMDRKLAQQIGSSIVDRALRKGYFEDAAFNANASDATLAEMRDVLSSSGMSKADVERALDVLRVQSDEANKAGILKHRMDLDYRASMLLDGEQFSIMDLIDNRVTHIVDQYNAQVATQAAFARMGLRKRSDIDALRRELVESLPVGSREAREAVDLFDNTLNHFRGLPAGGQVNEKFRMIQQFGRTVSLAWSGLWQLTEYANAMGQYGLRKTLKYSMQELPGFKGLMSPSKQDARAIQNVLADHSSASLRIRPYIARYEDGYEMDTTSGLQLALSAAGNMVPYANAMRYVHHHQARVTANLIVDRLALAAKGNAKAREALVEYGLERPVMDRLAAEITAKGLNIDAWDDAVWDAARPAFAKMMDASVIKSRLGDVPAFAAFDPVGKFLFTYRTFVLTAHNKILAGTLERSGAGALGLILMYQLPLAMLAVQAQSVIRGEGVLNEEALLKRSLGQMGGIGLFSEPLKWATGESNSVGAPGLIPIDRGVKVVQGALQGELNNAAGAAISMLPVANANPFFNSMAKQIKE